MVANKEARGIRGRGLSDHPSRTGYIYGLPFELPLCVLLTVQRLGAGRCRRNRLLATPSRALPPEST